MSEIYGVLFLLAQSFIQSRRQIRLILWLSIITNNQK